VGVLTGDFNNDPHSAQSLRREDFDEIHQHRTLAETTEFLRSQKVAAVVPGHPTALEWSDLFAQSLGVPGNPVASLEARFNKRIMKEYWAEHGVPCADWFESKDLESVLSWVAGRGFPVVLKPNRSSGSYNVFVCRSNQEVAAAFAAITTGPDVDGHRYESALVEEYLDGDEYFMNLLHDGYGSSLISLARCEKIERGGHLSIYRNIWSMALDDPLAREVLPQVQAANAALGVRVGINDTEFKMTSRGFRVIEVNNRLPGVGIPRMIQQCSGLNCYQENVRLFLGEYLRPLEQYRFARHYCICCLSNERPGRVQAYTGVDEVTKLPSFHDMSVSARVGAHCPETKDLISAWGLVFLVNEDEAQLQADADAVHALMQLRVE
jgi:biotin carboxylase